MQPGLDLYVKNIIKINTLYSSSGTLNIGTNGTITVSGSNYGTLSCSSNNTNIATCSVSGTTVTITPKAAGTATITVAGAGGTNYNSISKTYAATVQQGGPFYAFGTPTTSSTTNYSSLNPKRVFIKLENGSYSVCIVGNNGIDCIPNNSFNSTKMDIQWIFTGFSQFTNYKCDVSTNYVECHGDAYMTGYGFDLTYTCTVYSTGKVYCKQGTWYSCILESNNSISCS